jgi:hypothetical protein
METSMAETQRRAQRDQGDLQLNQPAQLQVEADREGRSSGNWMLHSMRQTT